MVGPQGDLLIVPGAANGMIDRSAWPPPEYAPKQPIQRTVSQPFPWRSAVVTYRLKFVIYLSLKKRASIGIRKISFPGVCSATVGSGNGGKMRASTHDRASRSHDVRCVASPKPGL